MTADPGSSKIICRRSTKRAEKILIRQKLVFRLCLLVVQRKNYFLLTSFTNQKNCMTLGSKMDLKELFTIKIYLVGLMYIYSKSNFLELLCLVLKNYQVKRQKLWLEIIWLVICHLKWLKHAFRIIFDLHFYLRTLHTWHSHWMSHFWLL